jgi:DNA-binding PadR family transcriptional regulator
MLISNRYSAIMARHAQTAAAVLGALSIEPMTGYEIRQAITSVLGHFWHESFGQIYPCLADLEGEGLVASTPGSRPRSTMYSLTDSGRARLRALLEEPPTAQPPRNGVLLRVFFGASLPTEVLAGLLDDQEAAARARLATYAGIRVGIAHEEGTREHHPFWLATVRAGELSAEATLQWLDETRAALVPPASIPAS